MNHIIKQTFKSFLLPGNISFLPGLITYIEFISNSKYIEILQDYMTYKHGTNFIRLTTKNSVLFHAFKLHLKFNRLCFLLLSFHEYNLSSRLVVQMQKLGQMQNALVTLQKVQNFVPRQQDFYYPAKGIFYHINYISNGKA